MKRLFVLMVLSAIVLSINLLPSALAGKSTTAIVQQPRPLRFGGARQLKAAFQNDEGKLRLVALVSPT